MISSHYLILHGKYLKNFPSFDVTVLRALQIPLHVTMKLLVHLSNLERLKLSFHEKFTDQELICLSNCLTKLRDLKVILLPFAAAHACNVMKSAM